MTERTQAIPVTLVFVRAGKRLLLLRASEAKTRFRGLWNGIGGHLQPGEDVREGALREVREETDLEPHALQLRAVIHETGLEGRAYLLFVFTAVLGDSAECQAPRPTREGVLAWFDEDALPWDELVPDLRELLPRLLASEDLLFGTQVFDGGERSAGLRLR
jgi:8-oxo-dGTP diphosphatase